VRKIEISRLLILQNLHVLPATLLLLSSPIVLLESQRLLLHLNQLLEFIIKIFVVDFLNELLLVERFSKKTPNRWFPTKIVHQVELKEHFRFGLLGFGKSCRVDIEDQEGV
jgi:hypothetical protein